MAALKVRATVGIARRIANVWAAPYLGAYRQSPPARKWR